MKALSVWKRVLLVFLIAILAIVAVMIFLYRDMLFRDIQNFESAGSENTISILYVGTSDVFWGKLPKQLFIISKMYDLDIAYKDISSNGARLITSTEDAIREMQNGSYDFIILQDNTRLLQGYDEDFALATRILSDEAKANGAIPVLYVPPNASSNGRPDAELQKIFSEKYTLAAEENNAILVDAGKAWTYAYETIPGVSLYAWDRNHPNNAGAFLTACVFAAILFDLHIENIPKDNLYKGDDVLYLAQAAWDFIQ
jgi:hypothetical protein